MKQKKLFIFLIFCLVLTTGFLHLFYEAQVAFSPVQLLNSDKAMLRKKIEQEKLKMALIEKQMQEQRLYVAKALPANIENQSFEKNYQSRNIASVLSEPGRIQLIDDFSKIQKSFSEKKYQEVVTYVQKFIQEFPLSPRLPDAYFLQAESYFLLNERELCLDVISHMVDLYPQHLLTGFILMRQAQILAEKGDKHQASDIFETVIENFSKEKDLVKQAETLKKAMLL